MENVTIPFGYIIAVIATLCSVVGVVVTALVHIFKKLEAKDKSHAELTKSFIEVSKDAVSANEKHINALERNTRVIEGLPQQILLYIKADRDG